MKRALALTAALALAACHADHAVSPTHEAPGVRAGRLGASLAAATTTLTFEGLSLAHGASVEGLGAIHANLDIHEITSSGARLVRTGLAPSAYEAPSASPVPSGCLGNPGGWTGPGSSVAGTAIASYLGDQSTGENYDFTFGGRAVSRFAFRMVDNGDFNPTRAADHRVVVTAYDAAGAVVDSDVLAFGTPSEATSPPAYQLTGDACTAQAGEPGNYVFTVSGPGITRVTLRTGPTAADPLTTATGPDPYVAIDDIQFDLLPLAVAIDIKPGGVPNCINNDGKGVIPVAVLGSATFDVRRVDAATVALEGMAVRTSGRANRLTADYEDVNADGFLDLVVHIQDQDGSLANGTGVATLTAMLTDGTAIAGSDEICIVPPQTGA